LWILVFISSKIGVERISIQESYLEEGEEEEERWSARSWREQVGELEWQKERERERERERACE